MRAMVTVMRVVGIKEGEGSMLMAMVIRMAGKGPQQQVWCTPVWDKKEHR